MLMPFLSVTSIGLVVGVLGRLMRGGHYAIWRGFFGAWAGFAFGALVGLVIDVTTLSEHWVPLLGHAGAVVGSLSSQFVDSSTLGEHTSRS